MYCNILTRCLLENHFQNTPFFYYSTIEHREQTESLKLLSQETFHLEAESKCCHRAKLKARLGPHWGVGDTDPRDPPCGVANPAAPHPTQLWIPVHALSPRVPATRSSRRTGSGARGSFTGPNRGAQRARGTSRPARATTHPGPLTRCWAA